ncbi:ABC transporter ATP-binding protein [Paenibacillus xylanexedens]|uniref:ABC transporter ATP-binding protein n=1 Tax=Paenibacillus xylanexedens TaxID=528191 RepID=UPI0011A1EDC4|nr:ATP-binding cassette domain-containing protein [Paenibacillus xylanexedens]
MKDIVMEVSNITKTIGKREIVQDTSFKLEKGKIYGFIGPNGAGKTTMMRMMTGLMHPTSGQVKIDSYDVNKDRKNALSQVGAIIESPIFFEYMTGRQVLRNLARMHPNILKSERESHISKLLERVGLQGRGDDKVKGYSLGMKQRLGIAQALLGNPKLLLLDEPSNGLDPMGMRGLRDIIFGLRDEFEYAFFISSHLLDELQQMCDELIIIKEGSIVWKGSTKELIGDGERLEDAFVELMKA